MDASARCHGCARIAASLDKSNLLPIGTVHEKEMAKLSQLDGLIGVIEEKPNDASDGDSRTLCNDDDSAPRIHGENSAEVGSSSTTISDTDSSGKSHVRLGLGAPGLITRRLAQQKQCTEQKRKLDQQWARPTTPDV